jgi:phage shock protein C
MPSSRRLHRSRDQRIVSGVCGGLADYLNMDATLVRVLVGVLTVLTGGWLGIIAYAVGHFVIPEEPLDPDRIAPYDTADDIGRPVPTDTPTTSREPEDLR